MDGWIMLYRRITENDLWTSEPFTRGQAWVDLLLLANHKAGTIRKQGMKISLDRGDVGWSEVELSGRWKWSRGKVRRFLDELKNDQMISRKTGQAIDEKQDKRKFVITITNYDKFQQKTTSDSTSDDTCVETSDGQATVQATDKRRYKNNNEKNAKNGKSEELNTSGKKPSKIPAAYSPEFESFWAVYPPRNGQKVKKAKAWEVFWKLTSNGSGITAELLTDKIKALAPQYGEYACDAVTWLNQRRWEDEVEPKRVFPKKSVAGKGSVIERAIANGQEWLAMQEIHQ